MLTKKQLLDAAQCCSECDKCACEMVGYRYEHCIKATAETALAYREMLDKLVEELRDAFDSGVFFERRVNYLKTQLEEAEKLLKESEDLK